MTSRSAKIAVAIGWLFIGTARGGDAAKAPSYRNEVRAVLSAAGCNQGTCHGNKNGKGGLQALAPRRRRFRRLRGSTARSIRPPFESDAARGKFTAKEGNRRRSTRRREAVRRKLARLPHLAKLDRRGLPYRRRCGPARRLPASSADRGRAVRAAPGIAIASAGDFQRRRRPRRNVAVRLRN